MQQVLTSSVSLPWMARSGFTWKTPDSQTARQPDSQGLPEVVNQPFEFEQPQVHRVNKTSRRFTRFCAHGTHGRPFARMKRKCLLGVLRRAVCEVSTPSGLPELRQERTIHSG
jgi:hypothetical protein